MTKLVRTPPAMRTPDPTPLLRTLAHTLRATADQLDPPTSTAPDVS